MGCQKTQAFLAQKQLQPAEIELASRKKYTRADLPALFEDIDEIYAAKGKKTAHFDLRRGLPSQKEVETFLFGRTGNFRSPALRVGRTLLVGFDESTFSKIFGGK